MQKDIIKNYQDQNNIYSWYSNYKEKFRWQTMGLELLTIDGMSTSHVFNSLKMVFNHMALHYKSKPVWHNVHYKVYDKIAKKYPKRLVENIMFFIMTIEQRNDLPIKYQMPYQHILKQLRINDFDEILSLLQPSDKIELQKMIER